MNKFIALLTAIVALVACSGGGGSADSLATDTTAGSDTDTNTEVGAESVDIANAIFDQRSGDCADYADNYTASVLDLSRSIGFDLAMTVSVTDAACTLESNNIPNHDFNDASAGFATVVAEVNQLFSIPRSPTPAATATALSQQTYDGVMLNGVPIDLLSAGCYRPDDPMADADGNVAIGCNVNDAWLLDPLGVAHRFGADEHNAHTQPNGSYHYHGNPMAMFDDNPGPEGSPVIGFAADGYPIYGSYFLDPNSGAVRKALSGYSLREGSRPSSATDPGGNYDGTYVDDWEFTDAGDLDACNGMSVNGQYGYYVTDSYPWILNCHSGVLDDSFNK